MGASRLGGPVPIAVIDRSLDHLVGAELARYGHVEAERLGRLQIEQELQSGRLLYQQLGGMAPFKILSP